VLENFAKDWPAIENWKNLEHFARAMGGEAFSYKKESFKGLLSN